MGEFDDEHGNQTVVVLLTMMSHAYQWSVMVDVLQYLMDWMVLYLAMITVMMIN